MITFASVSHFKSISEASLRFKDVNIIVGPNGSGKSNILDALYFVHDAVVDDLDTAVIKRHGIDSIRQWSKFRPFNITIELKFLVNNEYGSYKVVLSSSKGSYRILEESGIWTGKAPFRGAPDDERLITSSFHREHNGEVVVDHQLPNLRDRELQIGPEDLFLTTINRGLTSLPHSLFRPMASEVASFSKYNIYPNTLRNPQIVTKESTLTEDGSNLASVLKRINSNKRMTPIKEDIVAGIQAIMPGVEDLIVRSAGGFYVPVLRFAEQNGDVHDFNLSQISDGTLRTLGLLTAFYQPSAPSKIGVEEPEQMIHPGALAVIKEAMSTYVETRTPRRRQIFVTTHSPTLLDLFEPEHIIWARFVDGVTKSGHIGKRQVDIIKRQLFTAGEILLAEGIF